MAKLCLGIGASHTTLMNTQWDKVDHLDRAHAFRDALHAASDQLKSVKPDVVLVVGSNHFRGHWLDMMPTFCMGVDTIMSSGEHGTPSGPQKSKPEVAQALCNGLVDGGFDITFSTQMTIDHGISHAIQWLTHEQEIPIVPLMVNCFAPPLPSFARCIELGKTVRRLIEAMDDDLNVAVIASGGLSHQLPFPDWRTPKSENDAFLVDSWKHGRGEWEKYEKKRRAIIVNSPPQLNEKFDREFLQAMSNGSIESWVSTISENELVELAGNGANEIRTWLIMHAAMSYQPGSVLAYSAMPEWLTGMGVFTTNLN